ncbi:hypothetical protein [Streptomyces sp.]|uniref:hypothetical protein n=1 Tax=Streptomyces sp. TaxID=1931 RepID=UPI002F427E19
MNADTIPDLVTEETGNLLWFFPGTATSGRLGDPQLIGNGGWDGHTVITPGNTPADNGIAPLWTRNNTTGNLYKFTTTHPLIISVGDISGDEAPDLITTTSAGQLMDQLGTTTPSTTQFDGTPGKPAQIAGSGWTAIASISPTWNASPPPVRCSPPMVQGSWTGFSGSSFSLASSRARSGLPGE